MLVSKKERQKIAVVNQGLAYSSFPCPTDSVGIVIYELAQRLAVDCDVMVYTPGKNFLINRKCHDGINYFYVPRRFDRIIIRFLEKILQRSNNNFLNSQLFYIHYALQIANHLRKHKCDIVHIHSLSQFVPIIKAFNPEIKIVLHMHCQWLSQLDYQTIYRRLKKVDLIIGCSEYITEKVRRRFPEFAAKCKTIYNGVNIDSCTTKLHLNSHNQSLKNANKRLLFVGRVSPEKGVHLLLKALEKVVFYFPEVHLNVVGSITGSLPKNILVDLDNSDPKVAELKSFYTPDPKTGKILSYWEQLQAKISPELAKHVTFHGSVAHSELDKYYREADIFINSSLSEAFPIPIPEAMGRSLPVIGSRVGGIPEAILHEKTGIVVDSGDASILAEAILHLLNNDNLRVEMGKAGYQRAYELFSWEKVSQNLLNEYKNLCEQ
ncbi:MAG: glycosyltransferase family 4 protein [Calothrix sp. MO_192.B10]|nr:glycosyltransferase family 4 protein [Calothrix sp. MO_192.B10]